MATEALKTAYHFTELAVQPWVILQLCKGKDGLDTSKELLTNLLTLKQHARTTDPLGKGTETHGQSMCCSSLHFHPQTHFPTYIFLHTFWPTAAHSFGLLTFGLSQIAPLIQLSCLQPSLHARQCQESTTNNFTVLFSIWQLTKAAVNSSCFTLVVESWRMPRFVPLYFMFSVEGVAIPW